MPRCPACNASELTPLRKGGFLCEDCDRRFDSDLSAWPRAAAARGVDLDKTRPWAPASSAQSPPSPQSPASPAASSGAAPQAMGLQGAVQGVAAQVGVGAAAPAGSPGPASLEVLPFAIAHPLTQAMDRAQGLGDRERAAAFAGYQLVRLSGLLLLSDYLLSDARCAKVDLALRALRGPDFWAWAVLASQLARFWAGELAEQPPRPAAFPRLSAAFRGFARKASGRRESRWSTLFEGLSGRDGAATSPVDALWQAHEQAERRVGVDAGSPPDERAIERTATLVEVATERLLGAEGVVFGRLVPGRAGAAAGWIRLHGPRLDGCFQIEAVPRESASALAMTGSAALGNSGLAVPLQSLFVELDAASPRLWPSACGLTEPLIRRDDGLAKLAQVSAAGDAAPGSAPRVVSPALETLARKGVDVLAAEDELSVARVAPWAARSLAAALGRLRDRAYFPRFYVERAGLDDVAEGSLQQPGRALLVVGEHGAGKTSLLCRLASRFAPSQGDARRPSGVWTGGPASTDGRGAPIVVLLSGRAAYAFAEGRSGEEALADAVARQIGVRPGAFRSVGELCSALDRASLNGETRPLWLLLDGLDEAEHAAELVAAFDALLPSVGRFSWLRVCASIGRAAYDAAWPEGAPGPLSNERFLWRFHDRASRSLVPLLACAPFSADEAARAWALRRERADSELPALPAAYLGASTTGGDGAGAPALLSLPLHVHLYALAHASLPAAAPASPGTPNCGEAELREGYLRALAARSSALAASLRDVSEAMLALGGIDAPASVVERPGKPPRGTPNFAPLLDAGLLLPPPDDGEEASAFYAPVFPAVASEMLVSAILRASGAERFPSEAQMATWTSRAAGAFAACCLDALESLARRAARDAHAEALAVLVGPSPGGPKRQPRLDPAVRARLLAAALHEAALVASRQPPPAARGGQPPARDPGAALEALSALGGRPDAAAALAPAARLALRALEAAAEHHAAEQIARLALRLVRVRIADDPGSPALQLQLAAALSSLSSLAAREGRADEARKVGVEAARVLRALAIDGAPADVFLSFASSLERLADLAPPDRRPRDPRRLLREALEALRRAESLEAGRDEVQVRTAAVLDQLGRLAADDGALDEARARLSAAVQIRRRLCAQPSPRAELLASLASSLEASSRLDLAAEQPEQARRALDEAAALLRTAAAREPHWVEAQRELLRVLGASGELARSDGRREDARRFLEETLEGLRWLVGQDPTRAELRRDLAEALSRIGALCLLEGKRGRARRLLDESTGVLRELKASGHREPALGDLLASALCGLGNLARVEGKRSEARLCFDEAARLLAESLAAAPSRPDRKLALAEARWSCSLVEVDPAERLAHVQAVLALLAPLHERPPLSHAAARLWDMASRELALHPAPPTTS
jgi:tetratricopeptide (TPR) repeat protein